MNLSTFFRATLSADPTADVSLEEEIKLQRLYLDIEQIRFPDRLTVEIDVPDALLAARVPVLILQPVVENAVKYGVAKSRKPVTVRISVYEEAGRLHIKVRDDGEASPADLDGGAGTGVGLKNVCDRLTARYGARAGCLNGADPDGGYTVHLYLPVVQEWLSPRRCGSWWSTTSRSRSSGCNCCSPGSTNVTVVGTANDGEAALRIAEAVAPDLVLLDIAMPGMDGIDVARALSAIRGRPGGGVRHRLRQFRGRGVRRRRDRLSDEAGPARAAGARARSGARPCLDRRPHAAARPVSAHVEEFWVPDHSGLVRIAASDIHRITAERDYMRLHVGARSWLIHRTIAKLEEDLDPALFLRVHRSVILGATPSPASIATRPATGPRASPTAASSASAAPMSTT